MRISKDTLIKKYTNAIREGNAAIFAGAGLSRPSGFVDWKTFLKPLAEELELDIDKEADLLSLAQYYRNETGNRASINQEILNNRKFTMTCNHFSFFAAGLKERRLDKYFRIIQNSI